MNKHDARYEVDQQFRLPALTSVVPAGGRVERHAETLETAYHDTPTRDLLAAGATLSSRASGDEKYWQLALPGDDDPVDVPIPAAGDTVEVPADLLALSAGLRRGAELRHVATVRTHRDVQRVLDRRGRVVVQLSDDQVHSSAPTPEGALLQEWRALDVTYGDGAKGSTAARTHKELTVAGARKVAARGPLELALGDEVTAAAGPRTAGSVVQDYLREQDVALISGDLTLRRGRGGIHPTRVATRRMRSTLRIFGSLFDADQATALDGELSWYASVLGEVRDREVQRARMQALIAAVPDELVLGPVAARIEQQLVAEQADAQRALDAAMDGERYFALLRECHRWATSPPFTVRADRAPKTLKRLVERAEEKLDRHLAAGLRRGGSDDELHKARKAGKRARYAAELATPVLGRKKAHRLVGRYQELQDTLGHFQDGVVSSELLRRLGAATANQPGENGFTYGLLYAQEMERATRSRRAAAHLRAKM